MMKKKILVVDNHPVVLKFMTQLLEKEAHQVLTAEDGLSALEILKMYTPDVIFIDLIMPHIGGEKLCQIIRKIPALKEAYLIVLSAIAAEQEIDYT
ncbi:MAG: response regulator, partial [Desulfobacterales bacterium]|nr:response regulator [Desulfobacterales bacterium]